MAGLAPDEAEFGRQVAPFRVELKAHCYRMSGSLHDAEDLLQDTLLRAWRGWATFEGRASLRTWLYKIATNTCLNALEAKRPRAMPEDLGPAGDPAAAMNPEPDGAWLEPCPESFYAEGPSSPDARYSARESVALAFLAALQLLPARQRALLILHDVLGWSAAECAGLLELTPAAVNSALQRARETLAKKRAEAHSGGGGVDEAETRTLLARYVRAWETADLNALVSLLHEDATLSMPPFPLWLRGAPAIELGLRTMVFGPEAAGAFRLVPTRASGLPALAVYRHGAPYALQLLDCRGGRLRALTAFLDTSLFARLALPTAAPM